MRQRLYDILKKYLDSIKFTLNGEIDDKIFAKIQLFSLNAIRDCNLNAQLTAIQVASHFQVPHDSECKIISAFINLLKHDSNTQTRLLILDLIVLNDLTFSFIKNMIIYDSVEQIRNKALHLIENKVSRKFFDSLFRKQIINCLLISKNNDLLKKFCLKWLNFKNQTSMVEKVYLFICDLDLEGTWFTSADFFDLSFAEERLFKIFDLIFEEIFEQSDKEIFSQEILNTNTDFDRDINFLFLIRSFVKFYQRDHLAVIANQLFDNLKNNYDKVLTLYLLISILIDLKMDKVKILVEVDQIACFNDRTFELVYEVLLRQLDNKVRLNFVWKNYNDLIIYKFDKDRLKKFLTIVYILLDSMTDKDFENSTLLDLNLSLDDQFNYDLDLGQNIIEYFIDKAIVNNISDLDPKVRALTARALGHASLVSYDIAFSYLQIFYQVRDKIF